MAVAVVSFHALFVCCSDLQELESPDKLYLSAPDRNTSAVVTSTSTELPEQNTQEKEDLAPSKSSWADSMVTMETKDVKLTSPRGAESSVGEVVLRKKSRMSVISIASNISNRFRKSVDLDSEDAKRLVRETSSSERESSERDISEGEWAATMETGGVKPSLMLADFPFDFHISKFLLSDTVTFG